MFLIQTCLYLPVNVIKALNTYNIRVNMWIHSLLKIIVYIFTLLSPSPVLQFCSHGHVNHLLLSKTLYLHLGIGSIVEITMSEIKTETWRSKTKTILFHFHFICIVHLKNKTGKVISAPNQVHVQKR